MAKKKKVKRIPSYQLDGSYIIKKMKDMKEHFNTTLRVRTKFPGDADENFLEKNLTRVDVEEEAKKVERDLQEALQSNEHSREILKAKEEKERLKEKKKYSLNKNNGAQFKNRPAHYSKDEKKNKELQINNIQKHERKKLENKVDRLLNVIDSKDIGQGNLPTVIVYNEESHPIRIYKLCVLGLKKKDIAMALGITPITLSKWVQTHPSVAKAMAEGSLVCQANVAEAVYKRAVGFTKTIEEVRVVQGEVLRVKVQKYFPPNMQAAVYFLNNRAPNYWGSVKEVKHTGEVKLSHQLTKSDLSDFSEKELFLIQKMGVKIADNKEQAALMDSIDYDVDVTEDDEIDVDFKRGGN